MKLYKAIIALSSYLALAFHHLDRTLDLVDIYQLLSSVISFLMQMLG